MKKAALSIVVLGALGAGFLAGSWSSQRERVSAASLRARKVLYYVDPMHPEYKSDKPGIAPDCGMELEPIYADGGLRTTDQHTAVGADLKVGPYQKVGPHQVAISPQQQQLIGVRVALAEKSSGTERLRLYGRVAPDETRVYRVDVGMDGFMREISTATTGSQVRKDEWLATFSAAEVRSPIQAYLVALDVFDRTKKGADNQVAIDLAAVNVQQGIDRLLTLGMSPVQIDEIKQTRQAPSYVKITAPADGFVLARNISVGQKFERGDELYRVADLRRVWILADVFGSEAEYIRPGMVAHVSVPGRRQSLKAAVSRTVLPQFDAASQSVKVRLEADNPGYLLRPDMFVDVHLSITLPATVAIPAEAVIDTGLNKTVFVEREAGVFEPRRVETGWRFGNRVQILDGLTPGDRIVVSGAFLLDSESRMRRGSPDLGSRQ
jgi:Cu(I)/Ag(I) efflux system membrane fusion protein